MDLIKAILVYAEERLDKGAPLIKKENLPKTFHDVDHFTHMCKMAG